MRWALLLVALGVAGGCAALDLLTGVPPAGGAPVGGGGEVPEGGSLWQLAVGAGGMAGLLLEGARRGYVAHRLAKRGPSREKPRVDDHEARLRALEDRLDISHE